MTCNVVNVVGSIPTGSAWLIILIFQTYCSRVEDCILNVQLSTCTSDVQNFKIDTIFFYTNIVKNFHHVVLIERVDSKQQSGKNKDIS